MPYLGFVRSKGVGAATIRLKDRGTVNHVFITDTTDPDALVIESVGGDLKPVRWLKKLFKKEQKPRGVVRVRSMMDILVEGGEIWLYELPPTTVELEQAAWQWLESQIGKDYDHPGLVGFLPVPLPNSWQHQSKREQSARWFCSELATAYCQQRAKDFEQAQVVQWWVPPYMVSPEVLSWSGALVYVPLMIFPTEVGQ